MSTARKPTNPKDIVGSTKVPVGLVPETAIIEEAFAFLEGALKYGRYNWRIAGVSASIYHDAMDRHMKKWWNGQDRDPITRVRELASLRACAGILIDAEICGMLNDDRPPMAPVGILLDDAETLAQVAHLKELFKDHHPKQFTIDDLSTPDNQRAANGGELPRGPIAKAFAGPIDPRWEALAAESSVSPEVPAALPEVPAVLVPAAYPVPVGPKDPDGVPYLLIPSRR